MWPDNETADDLLGFTVHADLIRAVVTNPKMLPTIIGVFGDWGGGKTSIMKMLQRDLDPESHPDGSAERQKYEKVAVIYLNTWLFEGYDDAKSALLASILLELADHKRLAPKAKEAVAKLIKSVDWMRIARLGLKYALAPALIALATGGVGAVPAALALSAGYAGAKASGAADSTAPETASAISAKINLDGLIKESPEAPLEVRTFRARFQAMLDETGLTSIVVLIDDLDRCAPDRIVDSLEAIKLFLNVDRTAFVIGADPRIVQHAIRARYAERSLDHPGKREESDGLVKDYLEKVIQVPYHLPRLSAAEIESYMVLLFCSAHLDEEHAKACAEDFKKEREKNRYSTYGYSSVKKVLEARTCALGKDLKNALSFSASAAPLIADGLKGNPRQVKRFLNAFLLRKQLAEVAKLENVRDDVLVKLMILEYVDEGSFTELFEWQAAENGHPKQLAELERASDGGEDDGADKKLDPRWKTSRMKKWLVMQPQLKDVDLRDYFWVARDKLASTFSGLTMVPPVVRTALDGLLSKSSPKKQAAIVTIRGLQGDERGMLLNLLERHVTRQPADAAGHEAFRQLVEASIPDAVQCLAGILLQIPLDNVPPAVGMNLATLAAKKPDVDAALKSALDRVRASDTMVGRAMKAGKGGPK